MSKGAKAAGNGLEAAKDTLQKKNRSENDSILLSRDGAILTKAMEAERVDGLDKKPKKWQAHHIIPVDLRDHPVLVKAKYEINNVYNGIYLPEDVDVSRRYPQMGGRSFHKGYHKKYSDEVRKALDRLSLISHKLTSLQMFDKLMTINQYLRSKLMNGHVLYGEKTTVSTWKIPDYLTK